MKTLQGKPLFLVLTLASVILFASVCKRGLNWVITLKLPATDVELVFQQQEKRNNMESSV